MIKKLLCVVFAILNMSFLCAFNYNSSVTLNAEQTEFVFSYLKLYNNTYIIQNDSIGPIVVNDYYIIHAKSQKTINTNNIIVNWYK